MVADADGIDADDASLYGRGDYGQATVWVVAFLFQAAGGLGKHMTKMVAESKSALSRPAFGRSAFGRSVFGRSVFGRQRAALAGAALTVLALGLAGCETTPPAPPPPARPVYTSPIPPDRLVGRWGLAAYHRPDDATRTEAQAKSSCGNQPYVITAGTNGGVMMYLADDNKLTELVSKQVGNGPVYIGPPDDPAGGERDRQVVRFDNNILVLRFVDPEVAKRYGTMVYVRCA